MFCDLPAARFDGAPNRLAIRIAHGNSDESSLSCPSVSLCCLPGVIGLGCTPRRHGFREDQCFTRDGVLTCVSESLVQLSSSPFLGRRFRPKHRLHSTKKSSAFFRSIAKPVIVRAISHLFHS